MFITKIKNHYTSFTEKFKTIERLEALATNEKITPTALLKLVAKTLNTTNIEFAVAGGFARSVHTKPRSTADVDIIVSPNDQQRTEDALKQLGFKLQDKLDYQKPTRLILKYQLQNREVDILAYPKHPQFIAFLLQTSIKKSSYPFLGLEGLIVTKLCSFRYKDKADIVDLIELNPDLKIIKNWCSALGIMDRFSFMTEDHSQEK